MRTTYGGATGILLLMKGKLTTEKNEVIILVVELWL
jgi:short-subunit dehydrogenase involved in D-alanine esterification of teichoic acids